MKIQIILFGCLTLSAVTLTTQTKTSSTFKSFDHLPAAAPSPSTNGNHTSIKSDVHWTGGNFNFPCQSTKVLYKNSGKYISKNVLATRGQVQHDKLYLALPRYKYGIPATLVETTIKNGACSTIFKPYPSWVAQEEGNCKALQSVVDLVLDRKNILWVLDTGVLYTMENTVQKCTPKIVAIDTTTGEIIKTITLEGLVTPNTRLQYLILDYAKDGSLFAYISDAANRAIIVYNIQAKHGYRVVLPKAVTNGCKTRDILYLALVHKSCGATCLYFTYLGANKIYAIDTEYLKSATTEGRVMEIGTKHDRIVVLGTDNGQAIFFRGEGSNIIYRWNATKQFTESNFRVVYNGPTCQLATHTLADYKLNTMRVLQSNFPDYFQNTVGCGAIQQLSIMNDSW